MSLKRVMKLAQKSYIIRIHRRTDGLWQSRHQIRQGVREIGADKSRKIECGERPGKPHEIHCSYNPWLRSPRGSRSRGQPINFILKLSRCACTRFSSVFATTARGHTTPKRLPEQLSTGLHIVRTTNQHSSVSLGLMWAIKPIKLWVENDFPFS